MPHQTLPDSFYYMLLLFALMLLFTERIWHLAIIYAITKTPHYDDAQWKRYGVVWFGLAISLFVAFSTFSQYSVHQTKIGLNEMYAVNQVMGIAMWATLMIHLVTIPAMLGFWAWFYLHPVESSPRALR